MKLWQRVGVLLLLWLCFAQLLNAAMSLSATVDEGFHITSGYEYLRTGELHLFDEHPPLAKALFAWPLFFVPDLPPPEVASDYAKEDLIAVTQETLLAYRPLDRVIVAPRVAAALLTLFLVATLFRYTASLAGPTAGLLALTFCTFDPNFLAHGSLATTDMGATALIFWAIWAGTRWLERPTARHWGIAALLLGLAQGAKLTALMLYPVLGLGALVNAEAQRRRGAEWKSVLFAFAGMASASLLVLWALYSFELRPVPGVLSGLPLPAASHIERWLRLQENLAYGREAFLLGQNSMSGWWYYFPVAFLIKTPLPVLLLGLFSTLHTVYHVLTKYAIRITHYALRITDYASRITFYLFPLLYAAASLTSRLNIGYRHLLPVLPFLYVAVAGSRKYEVGSKRAESRESVPTPRHPLLPYSLLLTALLAWLALGTLRIAPHYLTFFNELVGGPAHGWRYLADSNTDWGQGLKALADYQEQHALGPVRLAAFLFYDPAAYGVDYIPSAPMTGAPPVLPQRFNPAPGYYAISVTALDGVPLPLPSMYDWFRHREPLAQIGYAYHLHDVPAAPTGAGAWIAQCTQPQAPLPTDILDEGFGLSEARYLAFDCEQSWLLPPGRGWYVRTIPPLTGPRRPEDPALDAAWPDWVAETLQPALSLSYVQPTPGALPPFTIWEAAPDALPIPSAAPATSLAETLALVSATQPAQAHAGSSVDVLTYWRVLTPPARPLSLMLHLRDAAGQPIAVGDGLGVPIEQWQNGDLIVQRHQLTLPPETPPGTYHLVAGAYWLDSLERLSSTTGPDIQLAELVITLQ